ncbi:hypothetical protein JCM5350_004961 [Sporobolomyces pararoseus]
MPATPRIEVEIKPVTLEDLPAVAQGNIDTLTPFHDSMEHLPHLPDRIERQSKRLSKLLSNPSVDFRKAVLKSTGELVGVALWMYTKRGEKPRNLKRRFIEIVREGKEKEEEEEDWKGVDWEKWNQCWDEWDAVRDDLMAGREHWYLVPLWVLPAFEGKGIGRLLLNEKISQCDKLNEPSTPIYLEASKFGKPLYTKLGFRQYGESYYCEMIRWGEGNEEDYKRCEEKKKEFLAKSGRTEF